MAARTQQLQRLGFDTAIAAPAAAQAATRKTLGKNAAAAAVAAATFRPGNDLIGIVLGASFYVSLLALIVFCILLLIHYTYMPIFNFTNTQGGIEIPQTQDAQAEFTSAVATVDIPANFVDPLSCGFTLMFDTLMLGDFKSTTAPRVLTYRSMRPVKVDTDMPRFEPSADLVRLFPDTNFLVWIDPIKNDLFAGVFTQEPSMSPVLHISEPLKNVPVREPFRVGFVLESQFLEIYMNGKLATTLTWQGTLKECLLPFYSPISVNDQSIFIGNMYYWSRTLRPYEILKTGYVQNAALFAKMTG
jgi:hypothetical protein